MPIASAHDLFRSTTSYKWAEKLQMGQCKCVVDIVFLMVFLEMFYVVFIHQLKHKLTLNSIQGDDNIETKPAIMLT